MEHSCKKYLPIVCQTHVAKRWLTLCSLVDYALTILDAQSSGKVSMISEQLSMLLALAVASFVNKLILPANKGA
jgi:hypothetical protein